jgi:hypothetical protein
MAMKVIKLHNKTRYNRLTNTKLDKRLDYVRRRSISEMPVDYPTLNRIRFPYENTK